MGLYPLPIARWTVAAVAMLFFVVIRLSLHEYYLSFATSCGSRSSGASVQTSSSATRAGVDRPRAFMSVGAYTAANLANRLGSPWPVNLLAGGLMAAPSAPSSAFHLAHQGPYWPSPPWPVSSS